MEKMEMRIFNILPGVEFYFVHTAACILISVPSWNWSFLWEFSKDNELARQELQEAVELKVSTEAEGAEQLSHVIYDYVMTEK